MKMGFLCGTHRVELTNNANQAINCWQDGFDTGQMLCDQQLWEEAIPHLGCAFETAEILMTIKAVEPPLACELFTSSSMLLAEAFSAQGYAECGQEVYWLSISRLERELLSLPNERSTMDPYLNNLYRQVQQIGAPASLRLEAAGIH